MEPDRQARYPVRRVAGILVLVLIALGLVANPVVPATVARKSAAAASLGSRPLGVFLSPLMFSPQERADLAHELGVAQLRTMGVALKTWDGTCRECPVVHDEGLLYVLTVRNTGDLKTASTEPSNLAAYREDVGRAVDVYGPLLVAVENEENNPNFYNGAAEGYGRQLRAACEATHSRGVPCTNGGLLSQSIKFFVYQHYVDSGKSAKAASYANRAFESWQKSKTESRWGRASIEAAARRVQGYLDAFAGTGVDFLNIHWYHVDGGGLLETVRVLRSVTGFEVVSNEMGQRNLDPNTTTEMVEAALASGMPSVVWYSHDGEMSKSLVNDDGSLRETGKAFRRVARSG